MQGGLEMKFFRILAGCFIFAGMSILSQSFSRADTLKDTTPKDDIFSAQATVTEVHPEENFFRAKIQGGLELTFRTNESTVIKAGGAAESLNELLPEDAVTIDYLYNENYEKVVRQLTVSSEKRKEPPV